MIINDHKYTHTSGMYVSINPTKPDMNMIKSIVARLNPPFSLDEFSEEAHMTIMYSRGEQPDVNQLEIPENNVIGLCVGVEYWAGHNNNGFIVLRLISKMASDLHDHILSIGAEHSFKTYDPHMTLVTHASDIDDKAVTTWVNKAHVYFKQHPLIVHFDTINIEDCKQD